jgi:hypothetical protein
MIKLRQQRTPQFKSLLTNRNYGNKWQLWLPLPLNKLMENIAFVLGNGRSRLALDLSQLKESGTVYGCNALYREFSPHVLVSTDPGISEEIQNSGYAKTHIHYTRKPIADKGSRKIDRNFGFSSGPIALAYAASSLAERIYFAGFDLQGIDGKVNNIYSDTPHYKTSQDKATFYGNWVNQIESIIKATPGKRFIRILPDGGMTPDSWKQANYSDMPLVDFLVWINKLNPR